MVRTLADSSGAIVRDLFDTAEVRLQIDPRPLRATTHGDVATSEDALAMAGRPLVDALPARDLSGRVAALRRAGVEVGDVGTLDKCPGLLGLSSAEERKACPDQLTAIAVIGVLDSSATRAVVQVLVLASKQGKFARITPYEMELRQGNWVLVRRGNTIIVE